METKTCKGRRDGKIRGCGRELPVSAFYKGRAICSECVDKAERLRGEARVEAARVAREGVRTEREATEQERSRLTGAPLCPRCKQRFRLTKSPYCKQCMREYAEEQRLGMHTSKGRVCEVCDQHYDGRRERLCPDCYESYRERECRECGGKFWQGGSVRRCPECNRRQSREHGRVEARKSRVRDQRFNLQPGQYDQMLVDQENSCACCCDEFTEDNSPHVDHDHSCCGFTATPQRRTCGKCTRGLVCKCCNLMLGYAHDDVWRLEAGIDYLKKQVTDNI